MTKLDDIALNIELVLISMIEALALYELSTNAVPFLGHPEMFKYFPYILAGFIFLLVFWSQAILHAVSFIRWPLRMEHMFLYFVAGFFQVVAFSNIGNIVPWFFWWTMFSLLTVVIYYVDLRIIRRSISAFADKTGGKKFIREVERRHVTEMKYLVPSALLFNVIALSLVYFDAPLFVNPLWYAGIGIVQLVISFGALVDCMRNFNKRSALMPTVVS